MKRVTSTSTSTLMSQEGAKYCSNSALVDSVHKKKSKKNGMIKEELLSIPQGALVSLCSAYDKEAGEYPVPCMIGRDVLQFYTKELEKVAEAEKEEEELIEELASIEHDQWISWAQSICNAETISVVREDRWKELWVPYAELTEEMKDQDRRWARKALSLVRNYGKSD